MAKVKQVAIRPTTKSPPKAALTPASDKTPVIIGTVKEASAKEVEDPSGQTLAGGVEAHEGVEPGLHDARNGRKAKEQAGQF